MRKLLTVMLIAGLVVGGMSAADAKKKKKPKPVETTLYLHGVEMLGEVDSVNNFGAGYNAMDTTEPDGAAPKSIGVSFWGSYPWNDCAGMYNMPVWTSPLSGKVVGDIKVNLYSMQGPRSVTIQIWPDVGTQTCAGNDFSEGQYPEPAAQANVQLAPGVGLTEVVIEDVNFKAVGLLMLQIRPDDASPGRLLYDAADYASSIEFTCVPSSGKSCV